MYGRDDLRHFLAALGLGALLGAAAALLARARTPELAAASGDGSEGDGEPPVGKVEADRGDADPDPDD